MTTDDTTAHHLDPEYWAPVATLVEALHYKYEKDIMPNQQKMATHDFAIERFREDMESRGIDLTQGEQSLIVALTLGFAIDFFARWMVGNMPVPPVMKATEQACTWLGYCLRDLKMATDYPTPTPEEATSNELIAPGGEPTEV